MPRSGWGSKSQQRQIDTVHNNLAQVIGVGRMVPAPLTNLAAKSDIKTRGAQISFQVLSLESIDHFVLLRNFSRDPGSAQAINTWPAASLATTPQTFPLALHYADADPAIAGKIAYYWIKAVPVSLRTQGNEFVSGPQKFDASQQPSAAQIMGDYAVTQSYTPTTQPLSAATGGSANHATITVAPFQIQYPFDTDNDGDGDLVSYSMGAIGPLLDSTKYQVYFDDPTYIGGPQTYIADPVVPNVTAAPHRQWLGVITTPAFGAGGTSGGGGGGGACFNGDTRVITRHGVKRMGDILAGYDEVLTQRGWRRVLALLVHGYDGPMCDMGNRELVTPDHRILQQGEWKRAVAIFLALPLVKLRGRVFNLKLDGDGSDEEQCYVLGNSWIAHNAIKTL